MATTHTGHESYPAATSDLARHRAELAPEIHEAFQAFSRRVFADGTLPERTKQLIAVAVAHVTQCPYCIRGHTKAALRKGATPEELMEAIWVAAEMRAVGATDRRGAPARMRCRISKDQNGRSARPTNQRVRRRWWRPGTRSGAGGA